MLMVLSRGAANSHCPGRWHFTSTTSRSGGLVHVWQPEYVRPNNDRPSNGATFAVAPHLALAPQSAGTRQADVCPEPLNLHRLDAAIHLPRSRLCSKVGRPRQNLT